MDNSGWNKEFEKLINEQISFEMHAFYEYYNMSLYFGRGDVALDKLSVYFKKLSDEEKEHADMFASYQHKRGGSVILYDIKEPLFSVSTEDTVEGNDILRAFEKSLAMEKKIYLNLLDLHSKAELDPHLEGFIESEFLTEQIDAMHGIGKIISNIKRIGNNNVWEFIHTFNK